jgi:thiamine-monophosphate kinase
VPVHPALDRLAGAVGADSLELALHGGEDYELLAALPAEAVGKARDSIGERFGTAVTEVGEVTEGAMLILDSPEEGQRTLEPRGWDHFAGG